MRTEIIHTSLTYLLAMDNTPRLSCDLQRIQSPVLQNSWPVLLTRLQNCAKTSVAQTAPRLLLEDFPHQTACYPPKLTISKNDDNHSQRSSLIRRTQGSPFRWDGPAVRLPLAFADLTDSLVDERIRNAELVNYLALYRASVILSAILSDVQIIDSQNHHHLNLVPGWTVFKRIALSSSDDESHFSEVHSLVAVSQSQLNHCNVLISTASKAFRIKLSQLVPISSHNSDILADAFYVQIANVLLPLVEAVLEENSEINNCNCQTSRLILHGHGPGGSISQIIAAHLSLKYRQNKCDLQIQSISIGAEPAFEYSTAMNLSQIISARSISVKTVTETVPSDMLDLEESASHMENVSSYHNLGANVWVDEQVGENMRLLAHSIETDDSFLIALSEIIERAAPELSRLAIFKRDWIAFSCALSAACHGIPWSKFQWGCNY